MPEPVRYISYGGGVQSTTLCMWAVEGKLQIDAVVFADTGSELPSTYATVAAVKDKVNEAGIPFYTVKADHPPLDVDYRERGMLPMVGVVWCTKKFKVGPVRQKVRELVWARYKSLKEPKPWATAILGITTDESHRQHPSDILWSSNEYPLIEELWNREQCIGYLRENYPELVVSKSGCFCCPYQGPKSWAKLRREHPKLFAKARAMEDAAKANGVKRGLWGERSIIAFDSDVTLEDFGVEIEDSTCDPGGGCFI